MSGKRLGGSLSESRAIGGGELSHVPKAVGARDVGYPGVRAAERERLPHRPQAAQA